MKRKIEVVGSQDALNSPRELAELTSSPSGLGIVKIAFPDSTKAVALENFGDSLVEILAAIGKPIRVYDRYDLWKPIGVNPQLQSDRAGGVGAIPVHIDLVNTTEPPDFVVFFCERSDASDGGQSVVAPFNAALERLPEKIVESLSEIRIREGKFFSLSNVGAELDPFPLLTYRDDRLEWVRYTGKSGAEIVEGNVESFVRLRHELEQVSIRFELEPGQAFIVNQHLAAHGRTALGPQQGIDAGRHRLLWQTFVRATTA